MTDFSNLIKTLSVDERQGILILDGIVAPTGEEDRWIRPGDKESWKYFSIASLSGQDKLYKRLANRGAPGILSCCPTKAPWRARPWQIQDSLSSLYCCKTKTQRNYECIYQSASVSAGSISVAWLFWFDVFIPGDLGPKSRRRGRNQFFVSIL